MIKLNLAGRSTTDVVVLMLCMLICGVMGLIVFGAIVAKIIRPEIDLSKAVDSVNQMLSTIVGAIVGFISGRSFGRREERQIIEQNGGQNENK